MFPLIVVLASGFLVKGHSLYVATKMGGDEVDKIVIKKLNNFSM